MLAVVPVRGGVLPAGADETVAECGGRAVVAGSAPRAEELAGIAHDVKASGAGILRGGAYKPRTSPYSFQGVGREIGRAHV